MLRTRARRALQFFFSVAIVVRDDARESESHSRLVVDLCEGTVQNCANRSSVKCVETSENGEFESETARE